MKNFVKQSDIFTANAPYAVASGGGALIGSLFGVAVKDYANGEQGEFKATGEFDLPCLGTDTPAAFAKIYWDDTNKRCTTTASGNSLIGAATLAKASGVTAVRVRLNGITI